MSSLRSHLLGGLVVALSSAAALAGSVRTLDGKAFDGDVKLDKSGALIVTPKTGAPVKIDLPNVLDAVIRIPDAPKTEAVSVAKWDEKDIGKGNDPGSAQLAGATLTIKAFGMGVGQNNDGLHLFYQTQSGDFEVVGKLASISAGGRAGIFIRQSAEGGSPQAALVLASGGTEPGIFMVRARPNGGSALRYCPRPNLPQWMRLVRSGTSFSGYLSDDGKAWQWVGSDTLPVGQSVVVGFGATGRTPQAASVAVFQQIGIAPVAKKSLAAALSRGVVLRSGSVVAGDIAAADDSAVRFVRKGEKELSISITEVARIMLKPVVGNVADHLPAGRTGVLLARGDFIEGEIKSVQGESVRLSSVLFGLKMVSQDAVAVVFGDVTPVPAQYEVRCADGSVLLGKSVAVDKEMLVVDELTLGAVRVPLADVLGMKAGAGRFQSLLALKPAKVDRERSGRLSVGLVVDAPGGELAMRLDDREPAGGLHIGAGATISYGLGGVYRTFVCTGGAPQGVLPTTPVRLVVMGDGKVLYRGPDCVSLDEPQSIAVPVTGVQLLSLRVEAAGADLGSAGFFAEPSLVK